MLFETTLTRSQTERNVQAGWWSNRLLIDDLDATASKAPDRIALVDPRGALTYAMLAEASEHVALGLLELGVRRGEVVTVQLPNWNEFPVLMLAVERIGAVINPVAPIYREHELTAILRLAGSRVVVTAERFRGFDHPAMFAALREQARSIQALVVVGESRAAGDLTWQELLDLGQRQADRRAAMARLRPGPDDICELIFTSGTTGEPKGVLHTQNTLSSSAFGAIRSQRFGADDVGLMASTFGHQTGFTYGVRIPLYLGATGVWQDVWDPATFIELVERHGVTFTMGATPFVMDVLRTLGEDASALRSLHTFISAGAPIPVPMAEEVRRRLPTRLAPGWGMTENGLVTVCDPDDPPERITSSDGRPLPGMELQVRDADGTPLPPGQEGDLYARGPYTFVGYVQGRAFTERYFDADGWFETGDRARLDTDGFLRITGRSKDIIIRGGDNIPVKEVEDLLLRHPAIAQVALVAQPDERLGERAAAFVVLHPGQQLALPDLQAHLHSHGLTRQFWPERLDLLGQMPTTPSGKIQKYRLREQAAGESE